VIYVGVFSSEEAMRDTWSWGRSTQEPRELFDTYLEFIRPDVGPLIEVFHIGSRWQFSVPAGNDDLRSAAITDRATDRRYGTGSPVYRAPSMR
jgi:hypothetical protein